MINAIPKNTIIRLLTEGLKSGSISPREIQALLPKQSTKGRRRTPKELRERAAKLSEEMGIAADGLKFVAHKGDRDVYYLYLLSTATNLAAGRRLGEPFSGLGDMRRAADVVLARYLESLT